LHQEDYCQALGKPPSAKYESNQTGISGPTLKEMFALTRRHMPPTEILRLLDRVIFNALVCNTDAHAKNYSIMIGGNGISLAPAYDVMCGEVWESVTKNLVHKIGGSTRGEQLQAKHWQRFARECGLNPKQVLDRVSAVARSVISEIAEVECEVAAMPAGRDPILSQVRQAILDRAQAVLEHIEAREGVVGDPSNIKV
jgi:serine/threonine-protein kinase HipA